MDWLQFISSVVGSLAWPAAAVILGFMFRKQVRRLLEKMRSLKAPGGIEASFSEEIKKVELQTKQATPDVPTTADRKASSEPLDPFARPSAVILDSWNDVESAVHELIASRSLTPEDGARSFHHLIRTLVDARLLPARTVALIGSMWELRGQVAHSKFFEPAHVDAKAYRASADRLVEFLNSVTRGTEAANVTEMREERPAPL